MSEAIFGLVGVVVGALITGGVEYVMRIREERAQVRAGARLVAAELNLAEYQLLTTGRSRPERFAEVQWRAHQALFARLLTGEEWATIEIAYQSLRALSDAASGADAVTALKDVNRAREVAYARGGIEGTGVGTGVPHPQDS